LQKVTVFLECGTAAGGIRENGVRRLAQKRFDVSPGQFAGLIAQTCVDVLGAATNLAGRDHHLTTVLLEHAHGCFLQAREGEIGDAPGMEGHAEAPRATRRKRSSDL
jgi:hypothetical protein